MIKGKDTAALAKDIFSDVVANRRHLHSNPELKFP
jgi:metal-dependent amidase/aminoacylase/carboxypeptidase family protein